MRGRAGRSPLPESDTTPAIDGQAQTASQLALSSLVLFVARFSSCFRPFRFFPLFAPQFLPITATYLLAAGECGGSRCWRTVTFCKPGGSFLCHVVSCSYVAPFSCGCGGFARLQCAVCLSVRRSVRYTVKPKKWSTGTLSQPHQHFSRCITTSAPFSGAGGQKLLALLAGHGEDGPAARLVWRSGWGRQRPEVSQRVRHK